MKKIVLIALAVVFLLGDAVVFAQKNNDFRYDMAGFAFEIRKVNKLAAKPSYFKNPEHYYDFGVAYLNFYSRLNQPLEFDQHSDEVRTDLYEQKSTAQVDINGIKLTMNEFEYDVENHHSLKLYYTPEDKLTFWEMDSEYPNCLDTAAWAFMMANTIGIRDGDIAKKAASFLDRTRSYLEINAYAFNKVKKYAEAYRSMRKAIRVMTVSGADSSYIASQLFNSGYFAYQAGLYEESEKTLLEAIDYKFKEPEQNRGGIYTLLADCRRRLDDRDGAFKYSLAAVEAYPDLIDMMYEVINHYVQAGDEANSLKYINMALNLEPENTAVLLLKASVIEEAGRTDEALKEYQNVIRIDPSNYKAWNHVAVIKYQAGKAAMNAAREIDDNKEYMAKLKEACRMLYEAVEPFEKCVELQPDTPGNKETLRSVYAAIRKELASEHPELNKKFEALDAQIKAAEGK